MKTDDASLRVAARDASLVRPTPPAVVCLAESHDDVVAMMTIAADLGVPVVPRGAGTGLAGGAVPSGGAIVVSTARMNRVLDVDRDNGSARVQPGVVNLDLDRLLRSTGFHFSPDPSSQQVCTLGGNVANNSGGPHCLAYGVTSAHVLAVRVVLVGGEVVDLGGDDPEPCGLDLRGAFIGGEGTLGIATEITVAITPNPPVTRTLLLAYADMTSAANTVSSIIAAGIVPAAMEVMDQGIVRAIEQYVGAGYPTDAGAVLLVEVEGLEGGVAANEVAIRGIAERMGATSIRTAVDEAERALLWKGRKTAFGAVANIAPDYYLHDTVVPRARLASVLDEVASIGVRHRLMIVNVFHAGDGNLHPLIVFDRRDPGVLERVHEAGADIVRASLAAGGVLSGEHGIGIEKQEFMSAMFTDDDLDHQNRLRRSFDPLGLSNPGKVLPSSHSCADIQQLSSVPAGVWL
ncbi:FAD-binding oxidoreductase [Ilumatobacter fluminis]|uniref:FAD-binding oxidoreductase n=1 Tax=Ilumatobacter fluminis TaxID=467091 RepID=UPI0014152CB2|nr:FAD-linked oxidase C-terminal domain-containing protein [Ilumatobacter fluminis]